MIKTKHLGNWSIESAKECFYKGDVKGISGMWTPPDGFIYKNYLLRFDSNLYTLYEAKKRVIEDIEIDYTWAEEHVRGWFGYKKKMWKKCYLNPSQLGAYLQNIKVNEELRQDLITIVEALAEEKGDPDE